MRVFITGVRGFIGRFLAAAFRERGAAVSGSAREPVAGDGGVIQHRLGEPVAPELLSGVDVFVHLAHDMSADGLQRNLEGTRRWFEAARASAVPRRIFVSSYSAHARATSVYGKCKWQLEQQLGDDGVDIVRPALVVGPGGLFARMARLVLGLPVVPLLDGGRAPMPVVGVEDLSAALCVLGERAGAPRAYNLANVQAPSFGSLLRLIASAGGRRRLFVPVPARPLLAPLRAAERLHLPLPVSSTNLEGFLANDDVARASDLLALLERESPLEQTVERAVEMIKRSGA